MVFAVLPETACGVFLGMGESNCAWNRKALLHRDTMLAAAAVYGGKRAGHPYAAPLGNWCLSHFSLTCASAASFLLRHCPTSCHSFQNIDSIAPYPFSKQSLLFPYCPLLRAKDFSCEAFSESWEYPNTHFSLETMTFIEHIIFPPCIFLDLNHYLSL